MKLFLLDGHALIFKMYYAFLGRPMINSRGVDTSILFGFTKYLLELIEKEKPSHLAVSFDPPGGTFRNTMYPEYKANRAETPRLVIDALEPLTEILHSLSIPVLTIPGFEADDVIGSLAKRSAREGFDVYMVTPDKDYGQLVEDHIWQFRPGKGGEHEILDVKAICAKYSIESPQQVIDILTICGDAADNVPGVKGVGEVGASKLLARYGSVENIYSHLDELTEKQRQMFTDAGDHIALSKELVTIKTDIPLDVTAEDMALTAAMNPETDRLFSLYEFNSLRRHLPRTSAGPEPAAAQPPLKKEPPVSDIAVSLHEDTLFVYDGVQVRSGSPQEFKALLEDPSVSKAAYSVKAQMNVIASLGIALRGKIYDVQLLHYLLNPEGNHELGYLAQNRLGVDLEEHPESGEELSLFAQQPEGPSRIDMEKEVKAVMDLAGIYYREAEASGVKKLYDEIEEPLIGVLSSMELKGVKVDIASLKEFADSLRAKMLEREREVRDIAGEPELNVSSPRQIGEVLFEKLRLDPKMKRPSKGYYPTDEDTLSALSSRSPIIDAILDYRALRKLLSTYIEPFAGYISPKDGRVHTTFNQALTATGRLSSSNPNLQNIPIRTEMGREIRKAFVPEDGDSVMMSADYSQIELRLMAHLSGDEHLTEAFRSGVDVHAATAAKIFGIGVEDVTPDQRRIAKTANFGIMYGISSFGLSQRLKCSRSEAARIIEDYFASFPSIRSYIDRTLAGARETSYVQTIFGRRRYIPDVNSNNANLRALAERNAVNAPIQGSSADIIKIAMIRVARRLKEENLQSSMVLQIHDELLLEVKNNEIERVRALLIEEMENVLELSVPLTVECKYGKTWLEAH